MTRKQVCNKVRYKTPVAARKAALRQDQILGDIYFCVRCDSYHLTHSRWRRKGKRIRH